MQAGIRRDPHGQEKHVRINEFQRGIGGDHGVAKIGRALLVAVLQGADEAQIRMFVEKHQHREPRVLEDGDEGFPRG